jgi:hypothetical protein
MITVQANKPATRAGAWLLSLTALCAGAWLGYDFGEQLGGFWFGLLAAVNGAAISTLLASAAVDSWTSDDPE